MKKSQVVNNIIKPNRIVEGKESIPMWYNSSNPIFIPKRKKRK